PALADPYVPSFPTRRSSDLRPELGRRHGQVSIGTRPGTTPGIRPGTRPGTTPGTRPGTERPDGLPQGEPDRLDIDVRIGQPLRQDRKSTRLNSSHLGISYAV